MCRYPKPSYAQLPRSLRVLRIEGIVVETADATIHAYGVRQFPLHSRRAAITVSLIQLTRHVSFHTVRSRQLWRK